MPASKVERIIPVMSETRLSPEKSAGGKVAFRGFKGRYRLSWKDASDNERETLVEVK